MFRWLVLSLVTLVAQCKITPGIFYYPSPPQVTAGDPQILQRTFFSGAELRGRLTCDDEAVKAKSVYTISVFSLKTLCLQKNIDQEKAQEIDGIREFLLHPTADMNAVNYEYGWIRCYQLDVTCDSSVPTLDFNNEKQFCPGYKIIMKQKEEADEVAEAAKKEKEEGGTRRRRSKRGVEGEDAGDAAEGEDAALTPNVDISKTGEGPKKTLKQKVMENYKAGSDSVKNTVNGLIIGKDTLSGTFYNMVNVTTTGTFFIGWQIEAKQVEAKVESVSLIIKARGLHGYLAAQDYPLLIFYAVLSILYGLLALFWLVICAVHWRDILQIQCWIGAILALNMVEMSVYFSKYETVNNGQTVSDSIVICAEIISAFKHALSRVLVLIICMGYGIVKPRLGTTKHLVFAVGLAYFLFVAIDGIYTKIVGDYTDKRQRLNAFVPKAVINAIIIWWIIASLVSTTRTLRIRRNVIKLTLYRHFTNCLVFAILSFLGFYVWWLHLMQDGCIKNWREYWLTDDIFWHLLFTLILVVIMFLWRPTINNSRYAFSPLLDTDEDEDEQTIHDAFEGMKLRNIKKNGTTTNRAGGASMEDDLKWVEENIPSSMADTVLEQFVDSEEENEQKLYEYSKMQ